MVKPDSKTSLKKSFYPADTEGDQNEEAALKSEDFGITI